MAPSLMQALVALTQIHTEFIECKGSSLSAHRAYTKCTQSSSSVQEAYYVHTELDMTCTPGRPIKCTDLIKGTQSSLDAHRGEVHTAPHQVHTELAQCTRSSSSRHHGGSLTLLTVCSSSHTQRSQCISLWISLPHVWPQNET